MDTKHSAGTHTHTAGRPVSIRRSLQCDPPSPGPRPPYAAGPEAWGGGSPHGGQRRAGVAPPLRLAFFPAPPTLGRNYGGPARGRRAHSCRIPPPHFPTPSPRAVGAAACAAPTRFGAAAREVGTPLFHSARTASGGKREKSCDPAPAKASGGVVGRRPAHGLSWQPEDGEASGAGSLKRCAALGDPWP